ncbi:galactokinase [soil metagenome]
MNTQQNRFSIPAQLKSFITDDSLVVRSPGRINLIGEHTDYNNGFVLPAAIDKAAWFVLTPRADNIIHLHSVDLNEQFETNADSFKSSGKHLWHDYILGVVEQFKKAGVNVPGFDAALTADVPIGAGLSSSAAIESAVGFTLNEWLHAGFDKIEIVKKAQRAENEFVGLQCGIMDMFASVYGKRGNVIKLDCQSLEYTYKPFNIEGMKVLLLDTNVKHSLASSQYNVRRQQCEAGVALIQKHEPHIKSLRDATIEMLDKYVQPHDALVYTRCRFIVEEIARLLAACDDLDAGNIKAFGAKMYQTHDGLSKMYEVSCKELDFLVDYVKNNPAVPGARMMGGGFGGCTINLVEDYAIGALTAHITKAYAEAMQRELKVYVANIEDGTSRIK